MAAAAVEVAASALVAKPEQALQNWNAFLSAEMSLQRGREVLQSLDPNSIWRDALLASPIPTDSEKKRIRTCPELKGIPPGISLLEERQFSDAMSFAEGLPLALLAKGKVDPLFGPTVGIVGTRSATSYGRVCARKFAEEFARHGITVVSGGAVGIDAAAHEGALSAGGATIAVLACGVDHVYPSAHAGLFDRICESGALVSQFALGTKPADYKFIMRNHLIAAMSQIVVVIEAPMKSGAIRTAGFAGEMGREVFVVPGPIDQFGFGGSHALIRDGATLVDHPMQVIEALGLEAKPVVAKPEMQGIAAEILGVLDANTMPVERIVELTGIAMGDVLAELTILELEGLIHREPGGFSKAL